MRYISSSLVGTVLLSILCGCGGDSQGRLVTGLPAQHYATSFDATEQPISETGRWRRARNAWTDVRTAEGVAFGTNGRSNGYDDSYALLSGFGPNQHAQAVIQRSAELASGITHEVELLLRFSDGPSYARGYECLFAYFGGVQVVRWNGAIGDYTALPLRGGPQRLDRELQTGDRIAATIRGNVIRVFINDELMAETEDSTYVSGQPGISFFTRPGGNSAHLALSSYSVRSE